MEWETERTSCCNFKKILKKSEVVDKKLSELVFTRFIPLLPLLSLKTARNTRERKKHAFTFLT